MNYAILLLAGKSTRFIINKNNKIQKQFYIIDDKPLYFYSLNVLNNSKNIDVIIILTIKNKIKIVRKFVKKNNFSKVKSIIAGGNYRSKTVKLGLEELNKMKINNNDIVLIHDAARPLIDDNIIDIAINKTKKFKATIFALNVTDSIIESKNKYVMKYLKRENIFHVQTPQTFIYKYLKKAYQNFKIKNDDSELVFLIKKKIFLLNGYEKLFKITTFDDIKKFNFFLKNNNKITLE